MAETNLNQFSVKVYESAQRKGFWDDYHSAPEHLKPQILSSKLMLCVTELAEACEDLRTGNSEHFKE